MLHFHVPTSIALAMAITVVSTAHAAPNALPKNMEPFNTVGRWIVDKDGRVVIQHGLNSINKFEPHTPFIRPEDADLLAREGMTQIRLGIKWAKVEPEPGKYDDKFIDLYIDHIKMLHARGIYSALTFFQDNYSEEFAGHGAPKWAVFTDGIPNININYYANPTFNPALQRAFDNFYANRAASDGIGIQDHYANAWAYVAKRLRDVPGVIGFDLMNEPQSGSYTQTCWLTGLLGCAPHDVRVTAFNSKIQRAIHAVDPNRLIIWEPGYHHSMGYASGATLKAPRAVYSFHQYCPTMPARQLSLPYTPPSKTLGFCQQLESYNINSHVSKGIRENNPPLMGEFGATEDVVDIGHVVDVADKHMLPWTHWAWFAKDPSGQGDTGERPWEGVIKDPTLPPSGDNLVHEKLNVLVRPHPLAVAGTPLSYSFSRDTKVFKLSYNTKNPQGRVGANAVTEVFVPARHYAKGYTALVVGGTVTSSPGADVLVIKATPGATKVDVTVLPSGLLSPMAPKAISQINPPPPVANIVAPVTQAFQSLFGR